MTTYRMGEPFELQQPATLRIDPKPDSAACERASYLTKIGKLQAEVALLRWKMIRAQQEAHEARTEAARLRARIEVLVGKGP